MREITQRLKPMSWLRVASLTGVAGLAAALILVPSMVRQTLAFVGWGLIEIAPLVIPGILLAAWVTASGAGGRVAQVFNGHILHTTVMASLIGAVTPVCGVTVLPLMAGLLASGVPLAPVMAFWLSSPITDPAMLATTAATLGIDFAIGKTVAAFGLGLLGGLMTAALAGRAWTHHPLRRNRIVGDLGQQNCCASGDFDAVFWRHSAGRRAFLNETMAISRLILICLIPAFAAEFWLNELLQPEALSSYVGRETWWAVPLAVLVGAPAYLDGYAALPLTRALIDHGMSPGAGMAFLVSGGVVSIWGAMAILPVLKLRPFLLYLGLAIIGSMASGWIYEWAA